MSRRAIISDIHSNVLALTAVLEDIKTQSVDAIVCLGDICGYGPQPKECIDLIRKHTIWTLKGNHDEALFVEPIDFGKNARVAIEWQRTILEPQLVATLEDEERWQWLQNLPPQRKEGNIQFVHASPRDPLYEYVLRDDYNDIGLGPTQKAKDNFACVDWVCFCGHSHRPGVVTEQDFHWWRPAELENSMYIIKRGVKTIVNVGSVGQPRDGSPNACYVLFDYEDPEDVTKTGKYAPVSDTPPPRPPANPDAPAADDDSTKTSEELKAARDRLLSYPRVMFRRVQYDVAAEQERFKVVPLLPEGNATRLARGQ
ncbi:MAG TPA: metallophosphoesterase family protein [Planctomycetota bacterium]|jgi:predicted phosphodiesterase